MSLPLTEQGWSNGMSRVVVGSAADRPEPGSHAWWLRRLNRRLDRRYEVMRRWVDYYEGRHVIKLVSEKFRDEFARRFPEYADNAMPLVVDTENNRLHVQGIRYGDQPEGDKDAWSWWQDNHLDADASLAHKDALLKGVVNILVWPTTDGVPVVTIEDALQCVVDVEPGRRWERRAALKRWRDDDNHLLAELYLKDAVYRYRTVQPADTSAALRWELTEWGGVDRVMNRLGIIPIVPLVNRPSLSRLDASGTILDGDDGQSELNTVISNQDHINAFRMMVMVSAELASFRQRWLINADIPVNPETGQAMEPFRPDHHLWVIPTPDPEEYPDANLAPKPQFGEFEQTNIVPHLEAIREEFRRLATKAQMPYHFLLESQSVPPSGESIKSAQEAFVMKIEDAQAHFGEGWEEVFRLNFLWRGDSARANVRDAEVFWQAAEARSEAVLTDAMVKAKTFGVEDPLLQERWGMSPQEIERNRVLREERAAREPNRALILGESAEGSVVRGVAEVATDGLGGIG